MPKYIYRMPGSDDELQHFDISDIGKGLSAAGKAIGDTFANLTGQKKKKSGKTVKKGDKKNSKVKVKAKGAKKGEKKRTGKYKGGKKDREWKNHKYGERHRNKDGKWVYDIDGVDRDKLGSLGAAQNNQFTTKRKQAKGVSVDWKEFPLLAKLLEPAVYLKDLTDGKIVEAGTKFVGLFKEGVNQIAAMGRQFGSKTDETGLPLKDGPEANASKEDDVKIANPGYENKDGASQYNCPACTMAYEMRRRGYEVTAKESTQGLMPDEVTQFFKDPEIYNVQPAYDNVYIDPTYGYINEGLAVSVQDQMSREEDGSRGVAWVQWYPEGSGGHIFNYEIENGVPVIYDGQSGQKHDLAEYSARAATWDYYRTDNLEPNVDEIKKVIK